MQKTSIIIIVLALIALLIGIGLNYTSMQPNEPVEPQTKNVMEGLLYPRAKTIADFQLTDKNNQPFTLNNLKGQWSLLFFGYTHCPDICPLALQTLTNMRQQLETLAPHLLEDTQFAFISVDGNRDTPESLKGFVEYFHPSFTAATGNERAINQLTRQLGIVYILTPSPDGNPDNYLIDHSSTITLIDPEGRMIGLFSAPHQPETLAQRYIKMRDYLKDKM